MRRFNLVGILVFAVLWVGAGLLDWLTPTTSFLILPPQPAIRTPTVFKLISTAAGIALQISLTVIGLGTVVGWVTTDDHEKPEPIGEV